MKEIGDLPSESDELDEEPPLRLKERTRVDLRAEPPVLFALSMPDIVDVVVGTVRLMKVEVCLAMEMMGGWVLVRAKNALKGCGVGRERWEMGEPAVDLVRHVSCLAVKVGNDRSVMGGRWSVWSTRTRNAERETRGMGTVGDLTIDFRSRKKEDDGGEEELEMEEAVEERGHSSEDGEGLRRRTRSWMEFSDRALGRRDCWMFGGGKEVEIKEGGVIYCLERREATTG